MIRFLVVVVLAVGLLAPGAVFAVDPAPRISDHEIIEGLADLNAKYTELKAELRRVEGELKAEFKTVRVEISSVRNEMRQMDKRRVLPRLQFRISLYQGLREHEGNQGVLALPTFLGSHPLECCSFENREKQSRG